MKKILLAALAAVSLFGATGVWAAPTPVSAYIRYDQVHFVTNAAANPNGGQVDTLWASRVGAAGASSVLDTTAAIGTEGWLVPEVPVLADTMGVLCQLLVYGKVDGGFVGCQSGADSLAVAVQVSADGITWVTNATLPAQTVSATTNPITSRNNQTIANSAFYDRLSLNGASIANGQPVWAFKFKNRGAQSLTEAADGAISFWPYIRFIFSFHDAAGYVVMAKVGHWSASQP
jgi:hypothetical protein